MQIWQYLSDLNLTGKKKKIGGRAIDKINKDP